MCVHDIGFTFSKLGLTITYAALAPARPSVRRVYPPPVDGHVPKFYLILLGTTSFTIRYDDTHARTLLNAA